MTDHPAADAFTGSEDEPMSTEQTPDHLSAEGGPNRPRSTDVDAIVSQSAEIDALIQGTTAVGTPGAATSAAAWSDAPADASVATAAADAASADHDDTTGEIVPAPSPNRAKKRKMNPVLEWIIVVAVAITSALLVRAYVVQQFAVEGESMMSTLHDGDRVLVNRLSYRLHDPRRGDVVVLKKLDGASAERDLIKRVVGLPGETIEVKSCTVYINGTAMIEPYLDPELQARDGCGNDQSPLTIPDDAVFVMGDHRGRSSDSRALGPIAYDLLIGRAFVIIWPVGDWAWL